MKIGRIQIATAPSAPGGQWLALTEQIRHLPGVQGVAADPRGHQVEIVFNGPAGSLLQQIHRVLQGAGAN